MAVLPIAKPKTEQPVSKPGEHEHISGGEISKFIDDHYSHYNAFSLKEAAQQYRNHIASGKKMFISLAGAMSTAELGKSLAEMIRQDKIHGISCTGANLEEDLFNYVAHNDYMPIPRYRTMKPEEEQQVLDEGYNRVTDTAIPEEEAFGILHEHLAEYWKEAKENGDRFFPHEYLYRMIKSGVLDEHAQVDKKDSWLIAACEKNLPIICPGWEDSSMGNAFAADCLNGICDPRVTKSGIEYMMYLGDWYLKASADTTIGFFQIGGGIAGDCPICIVPLLTFDAKMKDVPVWSYFCQVTDATTSYGGYSGAEPTEKITWGKLEPDTPMFCIESDATIVVPLIFAYVLGW